MQHVIVGLLLFQLLCLCNMQRRRLTNIINMLVNSVKLNSPSFQNHLHFHLLFKRTVCTNSKNIQTVDKNSWQLPKIKRIMQKTNPVKVVVENACTCVWKTTLSLSKKSSISKSSPNSFAVQKTSLQMNFSSKNLLLHQVDEKTFTCTQNAPSRYCNQFQLSSNHSASISEFCPNKPLTTSCCSHHASYIQKRSTCSPYARACIFPYPLLLRFPFIDSQNPEKSQRLACHTYV